MNLNQITQPFLENFPGDFSGNLMQRQTPGVLFSVVEPAHFDHPELIVFNEELSEEIGLGKIDSENDVEFLHSNFIPQHLKTYATAYAGHQFGNWAGQLGDGRAIFAGEIINKEGKKTELQWKGAGATPYSRHADGRAVLRSTLREYLMSEYLYHLGIPTTRALSMSFTGEDVIRDIMYNGNAKAEKGAVMIRTAESFLRFGHFELLSARKEHDLLQKLADFTIENYFPEIEVNDEHKYIKWFKIISERTADLIVEWFRVGFVHGVMNTDNMSVLGLSIDFGPFSMMDEYNLSFTSNTTDIPGRRYAFGEQGKMAQWNLWQLANALFPLIKDTEKLQKILDGFSDYFWQKHDKILCRKFGFDELLEEDLNFFVEWQNLMQNLKIDYALFFTKLESFEDELNAREHFAEVFYENLTENQTFQFDAFIKKYQERLQKNNISREESKGLMSQNNPKFILRNYLLFECIEELDNGKKELFNKLLEAIKNPYQEIYPEFSGKRPPKFDDVVGCTSLSCSS